MRLLLQWMHLTIQSKEKSAPQWNLGNVKWLHGSNSVTSYREEFYELIK
jgi:hypothetical protein